MRNFSYRADVCFEKYCNAHSLERSLMFRARADIASWTTPGKTWLDFIFDLRDEIHCNRHTDTHSFSPPFSRLYLSSQSQELVARVSNAAKNWASTERKSLILASLILHGSTVTAATLRRKCETSKRMSPRERQLNCLFSTRDSSFYDWNECPKVLHLFDNLMRNK